MILTIFLQYLCYQAIIHFQIINISEPHINFRPVIQQWQPPIILIRKSYLIFKYLLHLNCAQCSALCFLEVGCVVQNEWAAVHLNAQKKKWCSLNLFKAHRTGHCGALERTCVAEVCWGVIHNEWHHSAHTHAICVTAVQVG